MNNIVILGAGESGLGAALLAKKKGFNVFVSDSGHISNNTQNIFNNNGIIFEQGRHTPEVILLADEVIKSPGISPENHIVNLIKRKNINIISDIEFAARYTNAKLISITATNGKTTFSLLLKHILQYLGVNVDVVGNIGKSFCKSVLEEKFDYYIVEASSYQLEDIDKFSSAVSVILNITPDHLDRYNYNMQNYINAKFKLLKNVTSNSLFVYYHSNALINNELSKRLIVARRRPIVDEYIKDQRLVLPVYDQNEQIINHLEIDNLPLIGKHQAINFLAAAMITLDMGFSIKSILQSLYEYRGAPHRLELVLEHNGIKFINDSKAINIEAVKYALSSFGAKKRIIWIAGGIDKGNDYSQLYEEVDMCVKAIITLGSNNGLLSKYFNDRVSVLNVIDMNEAVQKAYNLAISGDVILLSSGALANDLFASFEERGEAFKKVSKEIAEAK